MTPPTRSERITDLTLAAMLVDRVHVHLALVVDVVGLPAVVVGPRPGQAMHLLAREISRRSIKLAREQTDE